MTLEAYFDESGIHDGAQVCVVGGFYGIEAGWRKVEKQWNKIISHYPELSSCGFHARDFFGRDRGKRVGPYRDWDDAKARKFLERLVNAIMRNRIFPIGYGIVVDDFLALPLPTRQWFTGAKFRLNGKRISSGAPKKSYYLPFQFCVLESAKSRGSATKVHYYAGLDRSFYECAVDLYKYLLQDDARIPQSYRSALGRISFPSAKHTPGLQASDLLVYRLYRYALDQLSVRKNLELPPLLKQLLKNRRPSQRFAILTAKELLAIESRAKKSYPVLKPVLGA